jgi:(2Fe-2S) ferredoxin
MNQLEAIAAKLHIPTIQRHIFICADQSVPKCCTKEQSIVAWDYLKRRIKELKLETQVFRTKANCLRLCELGPIVVIFPESVWYHSADQEVLERILQEHIINGKIVTEYAIVTPDNLTLAPLQLEME